MIRMLQKFYVSKNCDDMIWKNLHRKCGSPLKYSWPLNNTGLNCMGLLICGFFSVNIQLAFQFPGFHNHRFNQLQIENSIFSPRLRIWMKGSMCIFSSTIYNNKSITCYLDWTSFWTFVLPDEAEGVREAWLLGARGKPVLAAGRRKAHSCTKFMHRASSKHISTLVPKITIVFEYSSVFKIDPFALFQIFLPHNP